VSVSPSRKVYCWRLSDAVEKSFGNVALPRIDRLLPSGSALQLSDVGFTSTRATWPNAKAEKRRLASFASRAVRLSQAVC